MLLYMFAGKASEAHFHDVFGSRLESFWSLQIDVKHMLKRNAAAAGELMPSELYHQGGMRIRRIVNCRSPHTTSEGMIEQVIAITDMAREETVQRLRTNRWSVNAVVDQWLAALGGGVVLENRTHA